MPASVSFRNGRHSLIIWIFDPVIGFKVAIVAIDPAFVAGIDHRPKVGEPEPPVEEAVEVPLVVHLQAPVAGGSAPLHVLGVRDAVGAKNDHGSIRL
jgi:hypothetical protein